MKEILGHGELLTRLWSAAAAGRLGHSLLLTGPVGVGKFLVLERLAAGLLCAQGPSEPCGVCPACRRVAADSHPDILRVDALSHGFEELTIHFVAHREVRPQGAWDGESIEGFLRLVAAEGGWRVVLIRDADRMNEETQNAFLKTLEEPGNRVLLAMETSRPEALLDTVRSRVVQARVPGLTRDEVSRALAGVAPQWAQDPEWLRLAAGSPGRLLGLGHRHAQEGLALLAQAFRGAIHAPSLVGELMNLPGEFKGRTPKAGERLRVRFLLELGLEIQRDQERLDAGLSPDSVMYASLLADCPCPSAAARAQRLEIWLQARRDLDLNLNPAGVLERVLDFTSSLLLQGQDT